MKKYAIGFYTNYEFVLIKTIYPRSFIVEDIDKVIKKDSIRERILMGNKRNMKSLIAKLCASYIRQNRYRNLTRSDFKKENTFKLVNLSNLEDKATMYKALK